MGQIFSAGLEHIGRISNSGYVYNQSGEVFAKIENSGYIRKLAGSGYFGRIDQDGKVRDVSGDVKGCVMENGCVYIHTKCVCQVDSELIRRIAPNVTNGDLIGACQKQSEENTTEISKSINFDWLRCFGIATKLFAGVILWVWFAWQIGFSALGFPTILLMLPVCILLVFIFCGLIRFLSNQK